MNHGKNLRDIYANLLTDATVYTCCIEELVPFVMGGRKWGRL
jgi:uncharacterized membrane protein